MFLGVFLFNTKDFLNKCLLLVDGVLMNITTIKQNGFGNYGSKRVFQIS